MAGRVIKTGLIRGEDRTNRIAFQCFSAHMIHSFSLDIASYKISREGQIIPSSI
jgi:hypothetical protein